MSSAAVVIGTLRVNCPKCFPIKGSIISYPVFAYKKGPLLVHHRNVLQMVFRLWADNGPTLHADRVMLSNQTSHYLSKCIRIQYSFPFLSGNGNYMYIFMYNMESNMLTYI